MTKTTKTTKQLLKDSHWLYAAILADGNYGSARIADGNWEGIFTWDKDNDRWLIADTTYGRLTIHEGKLAIVSIKKEADVDADECGLNSACLGCDLETPNGIWVVPAEFAEECATDESSPIEIRWIQE